MALLAPLSEQYGTKDTGITQPLNTYITKLESYQNAPVRGYHPEQSDTSQHSVQYRNMETTSVLSRNLQLPSTFADPCLLNVNPIAKHKVYNI